MLEQVTNQSVVWALIAGVCGVILPIVVLLLWRRRAEIKVKPLVTGAIIFFVFSQILEGIPKFLFFTGDTAIANYVWSYTWAYVAIGCLLAGIFEEVGRYVAFRFFLKNYQKREDAITYGIGHGGIESILILGLSGISSIGLAAVINNGSLEQSLGAMSAGQLRSVELQAATLAGYGALHMLLDVAERCIAMTLHIALSIVVFRAVKEKKIKYLWIAVILHALFDVPAALYQCRVIGRGAAEIWLLASAVVVVIYARNIYCGLKEPGKAKVDEL